MRKSISLILFLLFFNSLKAEDYYFKGVRIPLKKYADHALISRDCNDCMAKVALKEILPLDKAGPSKIGSPGAKLCLSLEGAKYEIFDSKFGQQGFCLFIDGSYVDVDGLMYFSEISNKKKLD